MTTIQKPEMTDAFVLGGVRTPFARYGSSLSHIRVDDLLGMAMKGACERVGVNLDQIEDIIAGCVNPAHEGMGDIARWSALAAGFPDSVAGSTINRFCGSSLSATINVAHAIKAGLVDEIHTFLTPILVGGGIPALPDDVRVELELLDEHRFGGGVVYLRYRVAR